MKHIWTVLCQNSSVDSDTNLLSIFNCLEELAIKIDRKKAPKIDELVIPIGAQLISFWSIENQNQDNILEISVEILDPDGKLLNKFDQKIDIKRGPLRFRNILKIQGIKITKEGRYIIKMTHKKKEDKDFKVVAELPLDIKISYN